MTAPAATVYDYPQYFDLSFADETPLEVPFLIAACKKYGLPRTGSLLEPGCGGGRLMVALAKAGYRMTGFDLSTQAVAYTQKRLDRARLPGRTFVGDMRSFTLPRPVDAAFSTFNTFRHLLTDEEALQHLHCIANAIRPGGIYILGLHLLPPDADTECLERWTAHRGTTKVTCTLRVVSADRRKRLERMRLSLRVRAPQRDLKLSSDFDLRVYTATQFKKLLAQAPQFELCDVYDFWYEIDEPLQLTDEMSDTVFILRKRKGTVGQ